MGARITTGCVPDPFNPDPAVDANARIAKQRAINEARGKPHVAPEGGNAPTPISKAEAIAQHNAQPVERKPR